MTAERTAGSKLTEGCGPENSLKNRRVPRQSHFPTNETSSLINNPRIASTILHSVLVFFSIPSERYQMEGVHHKTSGVLHGMALRHHCPLGIVMG